MGDLIFTGLGSSLAAALIGAVVLLLRSSFSGIVEQWGSIFDAQQREIEDLRRELIAVRAQAAEDRARFEVELSSLRVRMEEEIKHERDVTGSLREENRRLHAELMEIRDRGKA